MKTALDHAMRVWNDGKAMLAGYLVIVLLALGALKAGELLIAFGMTFMRIA